MNLKKVLVMISSLFYALNIFAAVNINTATAEELQAVKGIGPKKAEAIVEYRTINGPFKDKMDLTKVSGIGSKTLQQIGDEITLGGTSRKASASSQTQSAKKQVKKALPSQANKDSQKK